MPPKRRAPPPPFTGVGRVTRSRSAANGISNDSTASGAPAFVAPSVAGASEEGAPVQEGGALSRGQRPKGLAAARKARSGDSSESATSTATPGGGFSGGQRPQGLAPIHGVQSIDDSSAPKAGPKARDDSHSMKGKGTTAQQREVTRHHLEMVQERLEEEKAERATMGNERKKRKIASPKNWAAGPSSAGPSDSKWNPVGGDETDKMHTSDEENENDFSVLLESSDNDDSDEDPEWEDVDLDAQAFSPSVQHAPQVAPGSLNLVLDNKREGKGKGKSVARGRTAAERHSRLEIHQAHLLCLLAHAYKRSQWCNNPQVQSNLEPLVNRRVKSLLIPNPRDQQFKRAFNFLEGLNTAVELWLNTFHITRKGVIRSHWGGGHLETPPRNGDPPMDKEDFLAASLQRTGSRDLGAQLFCALLRSVGVTCRLVCSLQPLSFSFRERGIPPKRPPGSSTRQSSVASSSGEGPSEGTVLRLAGFRDPVSKETRSGGMILNDDSSGLAESRYPVFWVEAWSIARQKWIPVDPLVTRTVGKPSVIEPPMSDQANLMSYVVAFDQDGHCRDVTKRYAKIYNGKTLKLRVTRTRAGELWWNRAINTFYRGWDLDRDDLEDSELQGKLVSEPMPKSIQDFKDHPLYVLKRHVKRGEVIYPEKQVGSVPVGGKSKSSEPVYPRRDLKVVRTAQQWHMRGREIGVGQQPLKYTVSRRLAGKKRKLGGSDEDYDEDGSEDEDEDGDERGKVGMYAEFQTILYEPPPVVNGLVPKNGYGNLDIFVPSMVPKGAVHLPFEAAEKAAKLIGVDYANAITGFKFSRRQALPIVAGVVVAAEYKAAVLSVVDGLQDQDEQEEAFHKNVAALMRWKRFIIRLRIKERLSIYDDSPPEDQPERTNLKGKGREHDGGGFVAASANGDDDGGGGFIIGGGDEEGGGGGFLIGDGDEEGGGGGGFIIEGAGSTRAQEEERPESGMDSDMLSEDPDDKDNEDLDWM